MAMISLLSAWLAVAPDAASPYSRDDLDKLIRIADAEMQALAGRCGVEAEGATDSGVPVAPSVDHEAELAYMRMAEMRRLAAQHYPYAKLGKDGQQYHSDDIHQSVQLYERAYACNPGWEQRRYLNEAIDMVVTRRKEIREQEARPESAPDNLQLREDEKRLREKLAQLRPPVCPSNKPACPTLKQEESASEPPRGYRRRFMDLFVLRVELGALFTASLQQRLAVSPEPSSPNGFAFAIAPGVRLLAGAKQRHVFGLGFRYAIMTYKLIQYGEESRDRVVQMAARLEYGVRISLNWLSVHASFEPGIQAHPLLEFFGNGQIGGSGSVCTWNEALCLRVGGGKTVRVAGRETKHLERYFDFGTVTFGIDVFRLSDNILRATEGSS